MSGLLDGKVVLINGGTQGVGGRRARGGARGRPGGGDRAPAGRRQAVRRRTGKLGRRAVRADRHGRPAKARRSVTRTEEFGRIDGLCNAAGITTRGTLLDTTPELFDTHIAVNLRGPFFAMQAAVADMVERGTAGSIVNIISIAAHGGQGTSRRTWRPRPWPDPQRRLRPPVGPHPHQRPQHRLDRKRRRNTDPATVPPGRRRLGHRGRQEAADGQTRPAR